MYYPHCEHCCWNSDHHPAVHETPCWSSCAKGGNAIEDVPLAF